MVIIMDLLQEYKELYNHEISFSDRLNSKIANSLAIITIIGTAETIVWKDCLCDNYNIIFFHLCSVSLICFLITLFRFYKAYAGYTYGYYPITETAEFVTETFRIGKEKNKSNEIIEKHISKKMRDNYIKAASINRIQNLRKSKAHRILNMWMIISIISVFICYACDIILISNIL